MKFEKTQPGNPHQLVVQQHVLPRAIIQRFADVRGLVEVVRTNAPAKPFKVKPRDDLFCVNRLWHQAAETRFSHPIEAEYNQLAERIVGGDVQVLDGPTGFVVSKMYALWHARFFTKMNPPTALHLKGYLPGPGWSKDEQEQLEKSGAVLIDSFGSIPARMAGGMLLSKRVSSLLTQMQGLDWSIVKAREGCFIASDEPRRTMRMPVSANICLVSGRQPEVIGYEEVAQLNSLARSTAYEYYFARDMSQCPFVKLTIPFGYHVA